MQAKRDSFTSSFQEHYISVRLLELWVCLQTEFLLFYSYYFTAKAMETVINYLHGDGTHHAGMVIH